jgi:hypothetical protein
MALKVLQRTLVVSRPSLLLAAQRTEEMAVAELVLLVASRYRMWCLEHPLKT